MQWGLAGPWLGGYGIYNAEDRLMAQLAFLAEHGFASTGVSLKEFEDPKRLDQVGAFLAEKGLSVSVHLGGFRPLDEDEEAVARGTDEFCTALEDVKDALRVKIVTCGVGPFHRFMAEPSLDEQLERLQRNLAPVAARCKEIGCPLGIENHGDYYCADLVTLCESTPGLGIFLDTGNCYLIGEQPIPACRAAAPYVIGTHFKDHYVHPDPKQLAFVLEGAPLGSGHVGLREIYMDLIALAPNPKDLVLQWELIPPKTEKIDDMDLIEQSWAFCRSLPEAQR